VVEAQRRIGTRAGTSLPPDPVAGYAAIHERLRQLLEDPTLRAAAFARLGVAVPRGVLLYGPPGCGKTALVRTLLRTAPVTVLEARAYVLCPAPARGLRAVI
jgi:ATP-dependent 26S proteasome regulatory subunit